MKRNHSLIVVAGCAVLLMTSGHALAIPTFQTYIDGATAGTLGGDEQTWFLTDSEFDLYVVGAYGPKDVSIDAVTLLLSVPKGELGTISITSALDEPPVLLTTAGASLLHPLNPRTDADTNVLSGGAGLDGYATKAFLPEGVTFNNHYPFQAGVSNFLLYDLGSFTNTESPLNNYNADDGSIDNSENASGEQKEYSVSFSGFSWVHFDVYGLVSTANGTREVRTTWDINPGSHDSTGSTVPVPGSILLGAIGLGMVGGLRKRSRNER